MIKRIRQFLDKTKAVEILTVLVLLFALGLAGYISLERTKEMNDSVDRYIAGENRDRRQGLSGESF